MASVFTHAAVPLALYSILPKNSISPRVLVAASLCSVAPDLDVIGFAFGIEYGAVLGHRGLTHSVFFALVVAGLVTRWMPLRQKNNSVAIFLFLFVSTVSHPILDSMTNGGLGVAFLAPFDNRRYFCRWRPIEVSPIWTDFFSRRGAKVILSELKWIWCPSAVAIMIMRLWTRTTTVMTAKKL